MNKLIFITGTTKGLGLFIKKKLVNLNYDVISISRNEKKTFLINKNNYLFIKQNLNKKINLKKINYYLKNFINKKKYSEIYFINNAAVITPLTSIYKLHRTNFLESLYVNIINPIFLTSYLSKTFFKKKINISFVHISTGAATKPIAGWSIYCSSKSFNKMFFEVLKKETSKDHNIKIKFFDPGMMDTNMQKIIRKSNKTNMPDVDNFVKLYKSSRLLDPETVSLNILKKLRLNN